jgi:hypothetical protein
MGARRGGGAEALGRQEFDNPLSRTRPLCLRHVRARATLRPRPRRACGRRAPVAEPRREGSRDTGGVGDVAHALLPAAERPARRPEGACARPRHRQPPAQHPRSAACSPIGPLSEGSSNSRGNRGTATVPRFPGIRVDDADPAPRVTANGVVSASAGPGPAMSASTMSVMVSPTNTASIRHTGGPQSLGLEQLRRTWILPH